MIIINQNKDTIINFDNIESINIVATLYGDEENPYGIYYEINSKSVELARYKTEEKAKEVLKAIGICYSNIQMINIPKIEIYEKIKSNELFKQICFEMPDE